MNSGLPQGLRVGILFGVILLAVIVAALISPVPQSLSYHEFADQREISGIPNFWDVVTNLPFLLIGILGIGLVSLGKLPGGISELHRIYLVFFIGCALVGIGSGYYHLDPSNETLFWDRLPMTVAFAAFFCIVIGEYVSVSMGIRLLWPLLLIGAGSVVYWIYTESLGRGDLRAYALVQFLPVILTLLILVMYRSPFKNSRYLWAIVVTFAMAKLAEALDGQLFELSPGLSGHSLKHLIASTGGALFFLALLKRERVDRNK